MIARLKVDSSEYDSKIQRAAKGIQHLAEACHNAGAHLNVLEDENREYIQSLGNMATVATTARGKIAELTSAFIDIKSVYNSLSQEEKNGEFGKELNKQLDIMKGRIQEGKRELADINNEINGGGGLTGALDSLAGKFGMNIKQLAGWGTALTVAKGALDVAKDAFFANEQQLDEWGRTVQASESLYQGFLNALNNTDISGFLTRMDDIISAARDAYNALDDLNTYSAFNQRNEMKERAGYTKALDEYKLNPTADNKKALADANKAVIDGLRETQQKTEDAYMAALRQIATERLNDKKLQAEFVKVFSEGGRNALADAKIGYSQGKMLNAGAQYWYGDRVYDGRIQDRSTGKWRDMSQQEKQNFEFARALSQVNDSQIKEVQALGRQSQAIADQIYQQDRAYNRMAGNNGKVTPGPGGGGGSTNTEAVAITGSIDAQTKKVQELQKAWRAAADDDSRRKIKEELESAQVVLNNMTEKVFDTSNLKQIAPTAIAVPKMELTDPMGTVNTMKQAIQLELKTEAVKVDKTTLQTMLKDAVQNGINGMDFQFNALGEKIGAGLDVPDSAWEGILEQYNAMREQIGLEPIMIDFKTGGLKEVSDDTKAMSKEWQAAGTAISAVGSAMQQIEDPAAKVMGTVAQAIATIALSYAQAASSPAVTGTGWGWIAFAATGLATMISTISAIHSATGYANGGQIKGNSYSGDNILGMVDGGGIVGLNAGEIVLNHAQQGVIASQLENGNGGGMRVVGEIQGEKIVLVANRFLKRSGQGELVTWK